MKVFGRVLAYNVVSAYGTIHKPGVFSKFLGQRITLFWGHEYSMPIGYGVLVEEREDGLYIEGEIFGDVYESIVSAHSQDGQEGGFGASITYTPVDFSQVDEAGEVWALDDVEKVWEVSLTPWPAVPGSYLRETGSNINVETENENGPIVVAIGDIIRKGRNNG